MSEKYIDDAHVTCSPSLHDHLVGVQALINDLDIFVAAAEKLDLHKKALFYGRDAGNDRDKPSDDFDRLAAVLLNLHPERAKAANMLHGIVGKATEIGELCEALTKALRGNPLDAVNIVEEVGDGLWYDALILRAVDSNFDTAMVRNIAKLRARFPNKFTEYDANNRNLEAERAILEDRG